MNIIAAKYYLSIIFLLLFSFLGQAQQAILSKKVTLQTQPQSIVECLRELQEKDGVGITFSNQIFEQEYKRSIIANEQPLGTILLDLLAGTDVNFKLLGNEIVLIKEIPNQKVVIRGYIRDKSSGEALIGANIFEPFIQRGSSSNLYGFYSLTLPPGFRKLRFTYFGEGVESEFLNITKDTVLNLFLETTLTLSEVVIKPKEIHPDFRFDHIGQEQLQPASISSIPTLAGEADLFRAAFLLPGVQSGGDGLGGLFVRGGNNDQNLILFDGVPVYNASHLIGIYSIFNSEAIRNSQLYKSAIPARFGGRLSSIFDVRTREGNEKKFQVNGGLGLISAKISVEGPIKRDTSAFFVSYRRSLLDLYMRPITKFFNASNDVDGFAVYNFQDLNAKVNYKISYRDRVYLSVYLGSDIFDDAREREVNDLNGIPIELRASETLSWGNVIGSMRWNHIFGPRLFSNTTVTFSRYNFNSRAFIGSDDVGIDSVDLVQFDYNQFRTNIEDVAIIQDFDFYLNPNIKFHFGLNMIRHRFDPAITLINEINDQELTFENILNNDPLKNVSNPIFALDGATYFESEFKLGDKIIGNIGVRNTFYRSDEKNYFSIQPRLSLIYKYKQTQNIKFALDVMNQPLHLLQRTGIGLPTDLWVPSNKIVAPQESIQGSLGWTWNPPSGLFLGADIYYKKLNNLITYQEGANFQSIDGSNWVNQIITGEGSAYGLELSYEQHFGQKRLGLNYTLAYSQRSFLEIANGAPYPFRYDRRHFLKSFFIAPISNKWSFTASWVWGTGNALTLPKNIFDIPPSQTNGGLNSNILLQDIDSRNNFRLPTYHRLDVSMVWTESRPKWQHRIEIGIFNLYNRKNPLFVSINENSDTQDDIEIVQVSLLPIIPSISYIFRR